MIRRYEHLAAVGACVIALGVAGCAGEDPAGRGLDDPSGTGDLGGTSSVTGTPGSSSNGGNGAVISGGTGGSVVSTGAGGTVAAGGGAGGNGGTARDAAADAPRDTGPLPVCNYPDWMKGTHYAQGTIVMYMGKAYIATNVNDGLDPIISTFYWSPYAGCTPPPPKPPPPPPPPMPCAALDRLAPSGQTTFQATYSAMFEPPFQGRVIHPAYTYLGFCKSLESGPGASFARSNNAVQDKREIAAFFANVAIETAYLVYSDEGGLSPTLQDYHGRGSLQITGRVIYEGAAYALGLDLVNKPQIGSTDPVVWQTGLWYWMQHANPSVGLNCHQAISAGNFGTTIRIIKGDCGSSPDRVTQYKKNCTLLGVDPGNVSCP